MAHAGSHSRRGSHGFSPAKSLTGFPRHYNSCQRVPLWTESPHVLILRQTQGREHTQHDTHSTVATSQGHPESSPLLSGIHSRGRPGFPSEVQASLLRAYETSRLKGYLTGTGCRAKESQGQGAEEGASQGRAWGRRDIASTSRSLDSGDGGS